MFLLTSDAIAILELAGVERRRTRPAVCPAPRRAAWSWLARALDREV
jgi:hypothetical protein